MSQVAPAKQPLRLNFIKIAIIALVVITACLHLYLAVASSTPGGSRSGGPGGSTGMGYGYMQQGGASGTPGAQGTAPSGTPVANGTQTTNNQGGGPGGQGGGPGGSGTGFQGGQGASSNILSSTVMQHRQLLFILNFIGYIVLLLALYLPIAFLKKLQPITRWVLFGYTAVTIAAYFLVAGGFTNVTAYADKAVEIAILVLLLVEFFQGRGQKKADKAAIDKARIAALLDEEPVSYPTTGRPQPYQGQPQAGYTQQQPYNNAPPRQ